MSRNRLMIRLVILAAIVLLAWLRSDVENGPDTGVDAGPAAHDLRSTATIIDDEPANQSQVVSGTQPQRSEPEPVSAAITPESAGASTDDATTLTPAQTTDASSSRRQKRPDQDADEPPHGQLTLVRGTSDEFRSSAGLMYVRGSQDGHRLKHVLKHAKDNPDKQIHGVFEGDRDQILAWIDRAWLKAKARDRTARVKTEGRRIVCTVDLGETIGFVGGQAGARKRHPPCRFLRLVVQNGDEVVTAYPCQSF